MASYVLVQKINDNYTVIKFLPIGEYLTAPNSGYPNMRVLYGDKNYPGDNVYADTMETYVLNRTSAGFWFMDYVESGLQNINGENLEFRTYSHSEDEFFETGKFKKLTVIRTNYNVDQDLDSVKEQLKNSTLWKKDEKINVPYTFKSKDNKITLEFNMSNDARYNIRDAYYLQQDMKTADISFFIDNTPIRLPKKYIKELFIEVNEFVYNILVEYQRQILNIESSDNIYDAQVSAAWVYEGFEIPERTIAN